MHTKIGLQALVLLIADVGLLIIQAIENQGSTGSVGQITGYASAVLSLFVYVSCQVLTRRHRHMKTDVETAVSRWPLIILALRLTLLSGGLSRGHVVAVYCGGFQSSRGAVTMEVRSSFNAMTPDFDMAFAQLNRVPRLTHVYVSRPVKSCNSNHLRSRPWRPSSAVRAAALCAER